MRRLATIRNHVATSDGEVETAAPVITDALGVPVADTKTDPAFAWTKKVRGVLWEKYDGDLQEADAEISKLGSPFSGAGYQGVQKLAEEYDHANFTVPRYNMGWGRSMRKEPWLMVTIPHREIL
jgi:hypothetical protein